MIHAAAKYSELRYGADYLLVWPRLAHLRSERFVQDYEVSRRNVDFLLVVLTLSTLFGIIGGGALLMLNGSPLVFAIVVASFGLAWRA